MKPRTYRAATVIEYTPRPRTPAPSTGLLAALAELPEAAIRTSPVGATKAQRAYMDRVAQLGCLLCRQPAQLHHVREGAGMAQKSSNWLVVPLCPSHHTGSDGIHGLSPRMFERRHGLSELDLLALTTERLQREQ